MGFHKIASETLSPLCPPSWPKASRFLGLGFGVWVRGLGGLGGFRELRGFSWWVSGLGFWGLDRVSLALKRLSR